MSVLFLFSTLSANIPTEMHKTNVYNHLASIFKSNGTEISYMCDLMSSISASCDCRHIRAKDCVRANMSVMQLVSAYRINWHTNNMPSIKAAQLIRLPSGCSKQQTLPLKPNCYRLDDAIVAYSWHPFTTNEIENNNNKRLNSLNKCRSSTTSTILTNNIEIDENTDNSIFNSTSSKYNNNSSANNEYIEYNNNNNIKPNNCDGKKNNLKAPATNHSRNACQYTSKGSYICIAHYTLF